ncbi:MAG: TIGR01777 family oxidoreductase [Chloroflexi bacterium]|nr:TIGR01777 family oxidoreductase [Chloroflexota bacterium]
MRVLLTGATGFVGRALVHALMERGDQRVALTRDPTRARMALPGLMQTYAWDPLEGLPPAEALEDVDAVVNLMGESVAGRWTDEKRRAILETRETGTRNLVLGMQMAARTAPAPRVLVNASAGGYYGHRGEEELTEDAPPGEGFLAGVCVQWEAAASRASVAGARVVMLRTGLVAGRDGGFLPPLSRLTRSGLSGPVGSGRQWWPWVHLDDMVGLILHALDNDDVQGPVNVCAPAPARQWEVARALGRVLRRPALMPAPAFALRLTLGGFASELLNSRRVVPAAALASGYAFRHPDLRAALRDIYA